MTPYTINVKTLIFSKSRLKLFLKYGYIQSHHYSNILTYLVFLEPPVCLSQVFVWRMENWFPTSKMTQEIPCHRLTLHPTMPSSPQCHLRIGRQSATKKQIFHSQSLATTANGWAIAKSLKNAATESWSHLLGKLKKITSVIRTSTCEPTLWNLRFSSTAPSTKNSGRDQQIFLTHRSRDTLHPCVFIDPQDKSFLCDFFSKISLKAGKEF